MTTFPELTIAKVIRACGKIDGRVKLQKIVYLLRAWAYQLPFQDFRAHHCGPFSPCLAAALDCLVDTGVLAEKPVQVRAESPRYDISLGRNWSPVLKKCVEIPSAEHSPPLAPTVAHLHKLDRATLEVAATICFLHREERRSGQQLHAELRALKGHLRDFPAKVKKAQEMLHSLGLLQRRAAGAKPRTTPAKKRAL